MFVLTEIHIAVWLFWFRGSNLLFYVRTAHSAYRLSIKNVQQSIGRYIPDTKASVLNIGYFPMIVLIILIRFSSCNEWNAVPNKQNQTFYEQAGI